MSNSAKVSISTISLFILFTFSVSPLFSQSSASNNSIESSNSGFHWSLFTLKSLLFESNNRNLDRWSGFGLGVELEHQFESGIGIGSKLSFRNWGEIDRFHLPLVVGPRYNIPINAKSNVVIYSGFGPSLVIGNDYASVFASTELGLRFRRKLFSDKYLILGAGFGQGMSFHPDHFEYLDFAIGIEF